ncbi:unnamed protein product [Lymnaea stagnalis]|uniref:Chromatin target of PRMT1 protein C-terminal domain-containing protein n=1 Tax=Lymnaea stagnalis TaxID=6523 RepID=A0AAV2HGM7_LYMST
MTTVPTKIVLKSTTRMSLNDRFSSIAPSIQNIRANIAAEQQVSAANRRLAQQLANRPGIQSSSSDLYFQQQRGGRQGNVNAAMKKKSLQQRLGKSNVKNRLSLPGGQQIRGRGRGRGRGAAIASPNQGTGENLYFTNKSRGRGTFSPRGTRGNRGTFRGRGRGGYNRFDENIRGGDNRRRGGRGRGGPDRFTGQALQNRRGGARGSPRGARRGARGQGRGGRGGRGRGGNNVSVQDLDNQLDEYMSKSRSHLDTELDTYMAESNN